MPPERASTIHSVATGGAFGTQVLAVGSEAAGRVPGSHGCEGIHARTKISPNGDGHAVALFNLGSERTRMKRRALSR